MGYGMQAFSELSAPQAPQALKTCYLSHHIVFGFSRGTWEERGEGRAGEGRGGQGGQGRGGQGREGEGRGGTLYTTVYSP